MSAVAVGSGLVCAIAIAMGFGFVVPVGATIGGLFDLVGIASGMVCFGLVRGNNPTRWVERVRRIPTGSMNSRQLRLTGTVPRPDAAVASMKVAF